MPTTIGPHLLGRLPNIPDERDWKVEDFLGTDAEKIASAEAYLKKTKYGYLHWAPDAPPSGSNWAAAFALLGWALTPSPIPVPPGAVEWIDNEPVLDQGNTGTCVGNGWAQYGNTLPFDDKYTETDARNIYLEASAIYYGTPDTTLQKGCDTRSGVKAMVARGRVGAYAFASTTGAITTWLQTKGPVVVGTRWDNTMFTPDTDFLLHPNAADTAGGHEWLLKGYDPNYKGHGPAYKMLNSWNETWGLGGCAYILVPDFASLLADGGDACVALELAI